MSGAVTTSHRVPPRRATTRRAARASRAGWAALVGAGLGLLVVLSIVLPGTLGGVTRSAPTSLPRTWTSARAYGIGTWENGVVRVELPTTGPTMTIRSIADPRVATTLALYGLAEVAPNGTFSVFASFANPNTGWNLSHTVAANGTLDLTLAGTVPELQVAGLWESEDEGGDAGDVVGNATVRVDIFLNGSAVPGATAARVAVQAANWTWEDLGDSLGLSMLLFAANETRIAAQIGPSPHLLQELTNVSGKVVASLSWSAAAKVVFGSGVQGSSSVASFSQTTPTGSNSTVRLLFGNVSGGYDSVEYDPWITLSLGAFLVGGLPAWSLGQAGWIVLGGAVGIVAVLALVAARRPRNQPTELSIH